MLYLCTNRSIRKHPSQEKHTLSMRVSFRERLIQFRTAIKAYNWLCSTQLTCIKIFYTSVVSTEKLYIHCKTVVVNVFPNVSNVDDHSNCFRCFQKKKIYGKKKKLLKIAQCRISFIKLSPELFRYDLFHKLVF